MNNKEENNINNEKIPLFIARFSNFLLVIVFLIIILLSYLIKYPDVTRETAVMSVNYQDSMNRSFVNGRTAVDTEKNSGVNNFFIAENIFYFRMKYNMQFYGNIKKGDELRFIFYERDSGKQKEYKGTVLKSTENPAQNELVVETSVVYSNAAGQQADIWGELEMRSKSISLLERFINAYIIKYFRGNK